MVRGWMNVALLAGISIMAALGASQRTPSLVLAHLPGDPALAELEARVASDPKDEAAMIQLARTLLDRNAPGLAVTVLERSPSVLQRSAEAADLASTAQLRSGKNRSALAWTRQALALCEKRGCEHGTVVRATRREELLEAAVSEGIEDLDANPEATARVLRKAVRQVQLAMN
ncbi:MAG: hypothetical protein MUF64_16905 [Polyangiaceae bacterium]|jgi:hypothetical protein|nr:hypothetical protein [Polyangiaceae bacterium]